jgi:hypothetical protein
VRLDERRIIDQALVAEEPCLGAVFCSYTFDPAYFEDHVLRALLRLRGDPEENAASYHEEARCALQETPVVCFVDASVRRAGRRLPYDLHLVRRRTFHPKVILVLYESEARLAVGSGNITKSGLEQNTELFFVRRLRYADAADAAMLCDVDEFLRESAALAGTAGTQLDLVQSALASRVRSTPHPASGQRVEFKFVSTYGGRLLDQLKEVIPDAAKITRVGVLAPFFEQDDFDAGTTDGLDAVLADLLSLRPSTGAILDVGAPWDDATVAAPASDKRPSLGDQPGGLWARRRQVLEDGETFEQMEYFVVNAITAKRVEVTDGAGKACRYARDELEAKISEHRVWPVSKPTVHAPGAILKRLADKHAVRLWLHPAADLSPLGRVRRRPLHAKAILVTAVYRNRTFTYALVGSANASRSALARGVTQGGNVEAGVLCRFDREVALHDLLPSLVSHSIDGVNLVERETPPRDVDLSAWIEEVVHDAAKRTLRVLWRPDGPSPLKSWALRYLERELVRGDGPPNSPTDIADFELNSESAEVSFASAEGEWQVPIRVLDLAALPSNPLLASLGLRELLALLGRRVGRERIATLRAQRGEAGVASILDAVFGEGFGPTDVFKAWWGAMQDLQTAATVAAFRHHLLGATGLRAVWQHLQGAPTGLLSQDEVWVYGCELLRELRLLEIPTGPDAQTKRALLDDLLTEIGAQLDGLAPDASSHAWLDVVSDFYGLGGRDGGA